MKPLILNGKCRVIRTSEGGRIDNIDTDMIFHNSHLHITDIAQMGQFAFGNLKGWEDFPKTSKPGDILVVGHNFGCGSSRQQAVDCFASLGIQAIVGESFGAIYKRNAINSGMPLIVVPGIVESAIQSGDELRIDLGKTGVEDVSRGIVYEGVEPFSQVQRDIYMAGSLFELGK